MLPTSRIVEVTQLIFIVVIGLPIGVGNILFWMWVARRGQKRFQGAVERRFGVKIGTGVRGHWKVESGPGSAARHLLIELLQLAYFMGAMVVWSIGMCLVLLLMELVPVP